MVGASNSDELRVCDHCGRSFLPKQAHQRFCGPPCSNLFHVAAQKARYDERKQAGLCVRCGAENGTDRAECAACREPVGKVRRKWVRPTWGKSAPSPQPRRPVPRGRYVYAWFKDGELLPFYVGKGVDSRAWDRHLRKDGQAQWCQTVRAAAKDFRVEIIRDGLTEEGALLLESVLMAFITARGVVLANQVSGMKRQERPPLELDLPS